MHYERQIQELKEENQKLLGALKAETNVRQPSPCHIKVEDDFVCLRRGSAENSLDRLKSHSICSRESIEENLGPCEDYKPLRIGKSAVKGTTSVEYLDGINDLRIQEVEDRNRDIVFSQQMQRIKQIEQKDIQDECRVDPNYFNNFKQALAAKQVR